jgi:hypothetical protein
MSRGRGGYIGFNRVPAAAAINSAASGVWSLREAEALKRAGTWPVVAPGNVGSGLQLWLDASDSATLFDATSGGSLVAADGGVARWEDKSGNGRHMTQGTAGSRPARKTAIQGGRDVLRFDGSNDFMSVASSTATFTFLHATDSTIFLVLDQNKSGYAPLISTFDTGTANVGMQLDTGNGSGTADNVTHRVNRGVSGSNVVFQTTGNAFLGAGFNVISVVTQPANATAANRSSIRRNGGTAATGNAATGAPSSASSQYNLSLATDNYLGVGSGDATFSSMDIAELIIYNSALSDTDRAAVETYLLAKWGIT